MNVIYPDAIHNRYRHPERVVHTYRKAIRIADPNVERRSCKLLCPMRPRSAGAWRFAVFTSTGRSRQRSATDANARLAHAASNYFLRADAHRLPCDKGSLLLPIARHVVTLLDLVAL